MATRLEELASALAYTDTDGFVDEVSRGGSGTRKYLFDRAKSRVGVDAVYFAGETPLVYFRADERDIEEAELSELHRRAWNDSRAPILIVSARRLLRVYDACATPSDKEPTSHDARVVLVLDHVTRALQDERLRAFSRQQVESGATWAANTKRFQNETRCDRTLLQNLRITRGRLLETGLPADVIHELLPRMILLLYLQHRNVLDDRFFAEFGSGANVIEILDDHAATYRLFDHLADRFNGDLLPVSQTERKSVTPDHLHLLARLLSGNERLKSGQMAFWPMYDFNVIPTELISSIYELFLRSGEGGNAKGLHYTPPALVELLLNEILPWPDTRPGTDWRPPRIIDPACGSGIFLVESYRRIVETVKLQRGLDRIPVDVLRDVMTGCIFGVDKVPAAVKIAAFSLYLAMLDYLQPKAIWQHVRFPKLTAADGRRGNLIARDAFDPEVFDTDGFDLAVGNPPWGRNDVPPSAVRYCRDRGLPIAKEIAHAFLWLAADLVRPRQGRAALFATSKWLFNRERPDVEFRTSFFEQNEVNTVLNFSALRRSLFPNAVGPASAVVFSPRRKINDDLEPEDASDILFCAPQARRSGPASSALLTDASEWKLVPAGFATAPSLWKVLTWGTWRDYRLHSKLRGREGTLKSFIKARQGWTVKNGFQTWDPNRNKAATNKLVDPRIEQLPYLPATRIKQYVIPNDAIQPPLAKGVILRRAGHPEAWQGPKLVVKEGQSGGQFCAAYVTASCTFTETVTGIAAPIRDAALLKALTVYLNSALATYFAFHNSTSWGIERERVHSIEWLGLPSEILEHDETVRELASLFDEIAARDDDDRGLVKRKADAAIYQALRLTRAELTLVNDFVRVTLPIIQRGKQPVSAANEHNVQRYLSACSEHLAQLLPPVQGMAWMGSSPLLVAEFRRTRTPHTPEVRRNDVQIRDQLARLDRFLIQQESESVFLRRHARLSVDDAIYIIKPADADLWTASAGINDADEIIADFLAHDTQLSEAQEDRG
jgi:hypothetical protein